ncbi:MAG: cobalamin-dependent protein [Dehalococcoidia bacterium]|nr:cobalamin-dependent protein [Dehalococcoidia bacterium]
MADTERKKRILLAKSQIDAHDRGVRYIARKLVEAGEEVIFIRYGLPDEIVFAALQEDVDVIGISFSTGAPLAVIPKVMSLLREQGIKDKVVIVGGIVPDDIVPQLKEAGVTGVFGPGSDPADIIDTIERSVSKKPSAGVISSNQVMRRKR